VHTLIGTGLVSARHMTHRIALGIFKELAKPFFDFVTSFDGYGLNLPLHVGRLPASNAWCAYERRVSLGVFKELANRAFAFDLVTSFDGYGLNLPLRVGEVCTTALG
jgi:hypothetical protein